MFTNRQPARGGNPVERHPTVAWCRDEKKSAPIDSDEVLVVNGEARDKLSTSDGDKASGCESTCSYISRRRSKLVGKNISKKPCLTRRVEHGTVIFLYRVWTTGALMPGIVSGRDEKSESNRRWRGKCFRNVCKRLRSRVGTYSGVERLGANGRLVYMRRSVEDARSSRDRGGECDNWRRNDNRDAINGSVTLV